MSWFRVSWPRVILRALCIPETSPRHLTVNGNKQKMVRAGVKGVMFLPRLWQKSILMSKN